MHAHALRPRAFTHVRTLRALTALRHLAGRRRNCLMLALGSTMCVIPCRLAAATFSFTFPMGRRKPRRLISPEIATLGRRRAPDMSSTREVATVAPADGPFFSASHEGKLTCTCFWGGGVGGFVCGPVPIRFTHPSRAEAGIYTKTQSDGGTYVEVGTVEIDHHLVEAHPGGDVAGLGLDPRERHHAGLRHGLADLACMWLCAQMCKCKKYKNRCQGPSELSKQHDTAKDVLPRSAPVRMSSPVPGDVASLCTAKASPPSPDTAQPTPMGKPPRQPPVRVDALELVLFGEPREREGGTGTRSIEQTKESRKPNALLMETACASQISPSPSSEEASSSPANVYCVVCVESPMSRVSQSVSRGPKGHKHHRGRIAARTPTPTPTPSPHHKQRRTRPSLLWFASGESSEIGGRWSDLSVWCSRPRCCPSPRSPSRHALGRRRRRLLPPPPPLPVACDDETGDVELCASAVSAARRFRPRLPAGASIREDGGGDIAAASPAPAPDPGCCRGPAGAGRFRSEALSGLTAAACWRAPVGVGEPELLRSRRAGLRRGVPRVGS